MPSLLRRTLRVAAIACATLATSAHVGTSNAYFDGLVGPYGIRVIVRTPGVIPGLAQISVRVTSGDVEQVTVRPLRSDVGLAGSPPPDIAQPVPGDADLYSAELWLMTAGSYSVEVTVSGAEAEGTTFVPVLAVAERRLDMHPAVGAALIGAALLLFVGAVTIVGAAVRESVLEPGVEPDAKRRAHGRIAAVAGALTVALLSWGGWTWWDEVDAAYRDRIYRPWHISAAVGTTAGTETLTVTVDDPAWRGPGWTPLRPDHGKLMHMFLVKADDLAAVAHLHPVPDGDAAFVVPLPRLTPGDYHVFADIVHESGFAHTLIDMVRLPAAPRVRPADRPVMADPDDSWSVLLPFGEARAAEYALPSGRTVRRDGEATFAADTETTLGFSVTEADGTRSALEPYMGMLSHAAVLREDGSLFVHLHPAGSINLAAQTRFEQAEGDGRGAVAHPRHVLERNRAPHEVAFPFVFPDAGAYRVVMQVKTGDTVETAAFDVEVSP